MSGQDAIRGFAVQTLICLLDALQVGGPKWTAVTLEPDIPGDKVDIFWEFNGRTLAQQVKSSKNQIGRAAVETWCRQLKASKSADTYQLVLAGPIAAAVLEDAPFDGVEVPTPTSMDTLALIDQSITKLDRYLLSESYGPIPLPIRESMISLISARLLDGSIRAKRFSRELFDGWLHDAVLASYPQAIEQRLTANCDVLWSNIQISGGPSLVSEAFAVILPLTIINSGLSVSVVEWVLLRVRCPNRQMLYRAVSFVSNGEAPPSSVDTPVTPFFDFAINPGQARSVRLALSTVDKPGFEVGMWTEGLNHLDLWVKYSSLPVPRLVKSTSLFVTIDERSVLGSDSSRIILLSDLEDFICRL